MHIHTYVYVYNMCVSLFSWFLGIPRYLLIPDPVCCSCIFLDTAFLRIGPSAQQVEDDPFEEDDFDTEDSGNFLEWLTINMGNTIW